MDSNSLLGHVITKNSILVDPTTIVEIYDWARPTSPTEIQSFIGLMGYYWCFVEDFSPITALLTKLTQKKMVIQ